MLRYIHNKMLKLRAGKERIGQVRSINLVVIPFIFEAERRSGWITYATAGLMQGSLLVMCLLWKARQARLRVDDFGNKIGPDVPIVTVTSSDPDFSEEEVDEINTGEHTSLLRQPRSIGQTGKKRSIFAWMTGR